LLPFSASIIPVLTNTDVCCPVPLLKQGVSQFRKRRKPQPEALDVPTTINCFFRIWRFGAVENICPNSTKGPSMSKNIVSQVYSLKDFTGNPQFLRRTFEAFDFAEDCVTTTGARPYNKSSFQRRRLGTWTWTIWSACHDATALRQVAWFRDLGAAANLHCVKIILCFTGSWLVIQVILFSGGPITGCPEVKHIEAKTDAKARLSEMRVLIPVTPDQIGMRFHAGSQLLILYLLMIWQPLKFLSYLYFTWIRWLPEVWEGGLLDFLWIGSRTKVPC